MVKRADSKILNCCVTVLTHPQNLHTPAHNLALRNNDYRAAAMKMADCAQKCSVPDCEGMSALFIHFTRTELSAAEVYLYENPKIEM